MSPSVDYAEVARRGAWLRHPVLGDPSFDAFVRRAGKLIYRGTPPREWAVNGFLFDDPQGGGLFAYVGLYPRDYQFGPGHAPSDCVVLRSRDDGRSWEEIGPVFAPGEFYFAGDVVAASTAPDVTVTYADGRYHLAYDWGHASMTWDNVFTPDAAHDSGVGYAWAERPEGPYHRHPEPILRYHRQFSAVPGKYRRLYVSTLLRRESDWLLLTLADSAQRFAWGLYASTAVDPRGPWSEPQLVLSLEGDTFHPALMEFFPQFVHGGMVYAPATSVALNRNFQCLWCAPLGSAHEPALWQLHQHGSLWHAEDRPEEHDGIWGQAFSGAVDAAGRLRVLFPGRDAAGRGTIQSGGATVDPAAAGTRFCAQRLCRTGPDFASPNLRLIFAAGRLRIRRHGASALGLARSAGAGPAWIGCDASCARWRGLFGVGVARRRLAAVALSCRRLGRGMGAWCVDGGTGAGNADCRKWCDAVAGCGH